MSDERLREAERKWRETGAVEDEARYLLERVRVGDLTQERLELAAYCGHEGARVARQQEAADCPATPEATEDWTHGLWRWGKRPIVLIAVVAAECAVECLGRTEPIPEEVSRAIQRAREYLLRPDASSMRAARDCARDLNGTEWNMSDLDRTALAAGSAASAAAETDLETAASLAALALDCAFRLSSSGDVMSRGRQQVVLDCLY